MELCRHQCFLLGLPHDLLPDQPDRTVTSEVRNLVERSVSKVFLEHTLRVVVDDEGERER